MKKRILIALFAGATVFGAAIAFAAALNLDGGNLQAGNDPTISCDADGVAANYTVSYAAGGYKVDQVTVTGINPLCNGRKVGVTLVNTGAPVSAEVVYSSAAGNTQAIIPITGGPTAASVSDVHAVIYG